MRHWIYPNQTNRKHSAASYHVRHWPDSWDDRSKQGRIGPVHERSTYVKSDGQQGCNIGWCQERDQNPGKFYAVTRRLTGVNNDRKLQRLAKWGKEVHSWCVYIVSEWWDCFEPSWNGPLRYERSWEKVLKISGCWNQWNEVWNGAKNHEAHSGVADFCIRTCLFWRWAK